MELPTPRHDIVGLISAEKPATAGGAAPNEKASDPWDESHMHSHRITGFLVQDSFSGQIVFTQGQLYWMGRLGIRSTLALRILTPNLAHTLHQPLPEFIYEASNGEVRRVSPT